MIRAQPIAHLHYDVFYNGQASASDARSLQLATAVLLVEVMRSDIAKGANDYFRLTSAMNEQFTKAEKIQVAEHMWQIAVADGHLDANGNHLISKVTACCSYP